MTNASITNKRREITSAPDDLGRVHYTEYWDTTMPPYCSFCGGNVVVEDVYVACVGTPYSTTEQRRKGCGAHAHTMPRAQCFFGRLDEPIG